MKTIFKFVNTISAYIFVIVSAFIFTSLFYKAFLFGGVIRVEINHLNEMYIEFLIVSFLWLNFIYYITYKLSKFVADYRNTTLSEEKRVTMPLFITVFNMFIVIAVIV